MSEERAQELADEIRAAADRLYGRDPARFGRLIVWIRAALKRGYQVTDVVDALGRLEEHEARGHRVETWWPYLTAILRRCYAARVQGESAAYKRGLPNSMKAVLAEVLRRLG